MCESLYGAPALHAHGHTALDCAYVLRANDRAFMRARFAGTTEMGIAVPLGKFRCGHLRRSSML